MLNINEMYDEYVKFYMFYMPHKAGHTETILYTQKKYAEFKRLCDDAFYDEGMSKADANGVLGFPGEFTIKAGINTILNKKIGEESKDSIMMKKDEIAIVFPCFNPVKVDKISEKYFGHKFIETEGVYEYYQSSFDIIMSFDEYEEDCED